MIVVVIFHDGKETFIKTRMMMIKKVSMMEDDTCGKKERKSMTKPCGRCGKLIPFPIEKHSDKYCDECLSKNPATLKNRDVYCRNPEKAKARERKRYQELKKQCLLPSGGHLSTTLECVHEILYDEPCFFCEYGCCKGKIKAYVAVSGKSILEELGIENGRSGVARLKKENIPALLDRDRFIVCCGHHASNVQFMAASRGMDI